MPVPSYKLTLHKTYYEKGFFNLGIEVERYVQQERGNIGILLGRSRNKIDGIVDRKPNINQTPRVFGGPELRNWFQKHYQLKEVVTVYIYAPNEIGIDTE